MGIGLIGSSVLVKNMSMAWQNVLYIVAAILVIMLCVFTLVIRGKAKSDSAQAEKQTKPLRKMRNARLYSLVYCVAFTSSISVPATVII